MGIISETPYICIPVFLLCIRQYIIISILNDYLKLYTIFILIDIYTLGENFLQAEKRAKIFLLQNFVGEA